MAIGMWQLAIWKIAATSVPCSPDAESRQPIRSRPPLRPQLAASSASCSCWRIWALVMRVPRMSPSSSPVSASTR